MLANYFLLILGAVVFVLHVPGLIIPRKHRELGRRFVARPANLRLIGLLMAAIGGTSIGVAPAGGFTRWFLLLLGLYMILSGILLVSRPEVYVARSEKLFGGPLRLWIFRAVAKTGTGLALVAWGAWLVVSLQP